MGLFKRPPAPEPVEEPELVEEETPEPEPEPEPEPDLTPKPGYVFVGPVVFASNGRHYPVIVEDGVEHGPDYEFPLTWDPDRGYVHARLEDPLHNHAHGTNVLPLIPGEE